MQGEVTQIGAKIILETDKSSAPFGYNYLLEKSKDTSKKRKEILHSLIEKQNELRARLDVSQIELLEEYEELSNILNCEAEKDSFSDGVRFAVTLIFEAVQSGDVPSIVISEGRAN